jgi:serine/threonine protein kinase
VKLYDSFETTKHKCFVMELCSGGDISKYVRTRMRIKEKIARQFFT